MISNDTAQTQEVRDQRHKNLLDMWGAQDEAEVMKQLGYKFRLPTGADILTQALIICFNKD